MKTLNIFNTVSPQRHMPFYTDKGNFHLKKFANTLEFSKDDISKITQVPKKNIRVKENKMPSSAKKYIKEIINVIETVANNFDGDCEKTILWFRLNNPALGDISPKDMICFGRFEKLKQIIYSAMEGNLA